MSVIHSTYNEIFALAAQLPLQERVRLVSELNELPPIVSQPSGKPKRERSAKEWTTLLEKCPVADDETIRMQDEIRNDMNQWIMQ